jgi:LmbE family N-acetylglucosaminyl deacetylase
LPGADAVSPSVSGGGIVCIFAHPDDETFVVGGTIPRYARAAVPCRLYCATDGDAGRSSGVRVASRAELGALRRRELLAATRLLGFDDVRMAGHPDGALGAVDTDLLVEEIVAFLRQRRPAVVITFGPEGGPNAHRDHRAISRAATAAYFLAGIRTAYPEQDLPPHAAARLFYQSWPTPPARSELLAESLPATVRIEITQFHEIKRAAFAEHRTQHEHRQRFEQLAMTDAEWFVLASGTPQPAPLIADLFEGM